MLDPVFTDKAHQPTDADLAAALGPAKRRWDALAKHVADAVPDSTPVWKHYAGKSGWQLIIRRAGRNFAYFKPLDGEFLLALALSETAAKAATTAGLPAPLIQSIKDAPRSPEGRAARIVVTSTADVATAKTLIAIKVADQ
jgi:hypothetical protein